LLIFEVLIDKKPQTMESKSDRPRIKIKLVAFDWVIEIIAIILLFLLFAVPLIHLKDLPATIPTHFNGSGQPDGYGSRATIWLLPFTGLLMYILLTVLSAFPHIYNYPVTITEANAAFQYRLATRLMRMLKAVLLLIFSFLGYKIVVIAAGKGSGLGKSFLPVFLLLTFGIIVFYIVRSLNSQHNT
jgi:uncharacterized membrane protein